MRGKESGVDFIVIGLSIAAGYRIADCAEARVMRMPAVAFVAIAIVGVFVGRNTAVLRVDDVLEVMLNYVIMGIAVGALIFKVVRHRQVDRSARGEAVADNTDSGNASE